MIKLKDGYLLHEICGTPYLLPYGQNIADFCHGIRLNESGVLLYRTLMQGAAENTMLAALMAHYEAKVSDIPALKEDIRRFLCQLESAGLLTRTDIQAAPPADFLFRIGPAIVAYCGPRELLMPSLFDFSCEKGIPDMTLRIIPYAPAVRGTGELLVRTDELMICKSETSYLFFYPADYGISEVHVSPDGKLAEFFCPMPYKDDLSEQLFHAFRFAYLIRAQEMGAFALHSASILYREKAWLFSGPSGIGKSTHTALWNRLYQTPCLNGDLNLLGFSDGTPVVYGLPWCGTSGLYTTKTIPLCGITFLKQSPFDTLSELSEEEAALRTMQRLISPAWTADMLLANLSFAEKLSSRTSFFRLFCTKEDSAAAVMKEAIDAVVFSKKL